MATQPEQKTGAAQAAKPAAAKPVAQGASAGAASPKAVAGRPVGVREELEEMAEQGAGAIWFRDLLRATPSWLVSMIVHMIVLLVLALLQLPETAADEDREIVAAQPEEQEVFEEEELIIPEDPPPVRLDTVDIINPVDVDVELEPAEMVSPFDEDTMAAMEFELGDNPEMFAPADGLLTSRGAAYGGDLTGRGKGRKGTAMRYGASAASEAAVALALKWLANHQFPDGGWSFNHHMSPQCQGKCRNPGSLGNEGRVAATSLAVLPFLGAGQTHKDGEYKGTVRGGLQFLVYRMKHSAQGGSLHEPGGRMYSHGLASIALCEAYAMTRDRGLQGPAQAAVNFICYAQDPVGGGWRYEPRQKGDTSVVGWQLMALKSAHMAYLRVPEETIKKAYMYLDTVQANSGANYGYTTPGSGQATTAIGLLCRMYLGWKQEDPRLERGVEWISNQGPSKGNMYYNYYATQVIRHYDSENNGPLWKKWNGVMRDQLVNSQSKQGHEEGSWHMKGDHGADRGGRLYCTGMATMVLEVYYRHMPIYRKQAHEDEFPALK